MARFDVNDATLQQIAKQIAPVAGWHSVTDISGEDIGYLEADEITVTDTPVSEWIEARGEPKREDGVLVFETVTRTRNLMKPGRSPSESSVTVYVVEVDGGTAAYIER